MDYEEAFAFVPKYASIRAVRSIASEVGCRIHQMDVKIAFLNAVIEEKVCFE